MLLKVINFFKPPNKWKIPVIVLLGIFIGLGTYSFYISKAWSYISDDPKACVNCHIMAPQYATWIHSSHRETAHCNDCHVPHDNFARKYYFKGKDGLRHATLFTLRAERQVQSKIITQTKGQYQVHNTDRECWECHREVPHGRVNSLSSVPNAKVPVPESPVPEWLKKIIKK